jgi:hypothetical protein
METISELSLCFSRFRDPVKRGVVVCSMVIAYPVPGVCALGRGNTRAMRLKEAGDLGKLAPSRCPRERRHPYGPYQDPTPLRTAVCVCMRAQCPVDLKLDFGCA